MGKSLLRVCSKENLMPHRAMVRELLAYFLTFLRCRRFPSAPVWGRSPSCVNRRVAANPTFSSATEGCKNGESDDGADEDQNSVAPHKGYRRVREMWLQLAGIDFPPSAAHVTKQEVLLLCNEIEDPVKAKVSVLQYDV